MNPQWKSIALPKEHGAWVMLIEAIIVGMGLSLSPSAVFLSAIAILALFLVNPLKILLRDMKEKKQYPRTGLAFIFTLIYSGFIIGLLGVVGYFNRNAFWVPLAVAAVLFLIQIWYGLQRQDKSLAAEIVGGLATGAIAASILLAGGYSFVTAVCVWGFLVVRALTSIYYVRQRLRKARGERFSSPVNFGIHLIGLVLVSGFVGAGGFGMMILVMFVVLSARSAYGLSCFAKNIRPQAVGIQEVVFGLLNSVVIIYSVNGL